jgi:hypothetical protein
VFQTVETRVVADVGDITMLEQCLKMARETCISEE